MPDAVKTDSLDLDNLRDRCAMRGIKWHPRHKPETLQRLIDEYEQNQPAPEPAPEQKVELDQTESFSNSEPQRPTWTGPAERFQPPRKHELPRNVYEALDWLSHSSIGRVNTVCRFIDTL